MKNSKLSSPVIHASDCVASPKPNHTSALEDVSDSHVQLKQPCDIELPLPSDQASQSRSNDHGEPLAQLISTVANYWGHQQLRPLQAESMLACLQRQDSLTVLPTGAGKSICFQAPALLLSGTALVVSPLISLMKDQVDNLCKRNIPAAFVNSSLSSAERRDVMEKVCHGRLKLLYIAPEGLAQEKTLNFLAKQEISFVALDEAHCVSGWGHDFREEYRRLGILKDKLHNIPIHAYTATASPRVRRDIIEQLRLKNAKLFVANMDRPNLLYRSIPATNREPQIVDIVKQNRGKAGIIFCFSRRETERIAYTLRQNGFRADAYHAGLDALERKNIQDNFLTDRTQIIVATTAFGMGIDKSNVRYVIHTLIPKSLENYLQEAGRVGRDGQPAECIILYRASDRNKWRRLSGTSTAQWQHTKISEQHAIADYASSNQCRRRILLEAMGQAFHYANCGACDICLGHFQQCENSSDIILKILSAIKRTGENYSLKVINDILLGIKPKTAVSSDFRALSTFGILRDQTSFQVEDWIEQIVSLGLIRFRDPTTILQITSVGNEILRGKRASPFLLDRFQKPSPTQLSQWSPAASVDLELFQITENWLHSQVDRETPLCPSLAWQIARVKPRSIEQLASLAQCHPDTIRDTCSGLLAVINEYCRKRNLQSEMQLDQRYFASLATEIDPERTGRIKTANNAALRYFPAFEAGTSIEEIATQYGVKPGTIFDYLCVFIEERRITDCTTWISASTISRIEATIDLVGMERYRPIFEQLHEEVSYGEIKAVCAARKVRMEHVTLLLESEYNAEGI